MHIPKWKATYFMIPTVWDSRKDKTIQTVRGSLIAKGLVWLGWIGVTRGFWKQGNHSLWYYNSRDVIIYLSNP